jgi:hypothetical protein
VGRRSDLAISVRFVLVAVIFDAVAASGRNCNFPKPSIPPMAVAAAFSAGRMNMPICAGRLVDRLRTRPRISGAPEHSFNWIRLH